MTTISNATVTINSDALIVPDLHGEAWRLIRDPAQSDVPNSGAVNMARDEALLRAVMTTRQPVLRLYRWNVPTLSLGFSQPVADIDRPRLAAHGWQAVRRLTGGRAILHTDEITYAVAVPLDHPLGQGSIIESYRRISAALLAALEQIGLAASAEKHAKQGGTPNPVCFEVPSNYEIAVGGRKLAGSAQVRKHGALLQHGTLPLTGDLARICDCLHYPDEEARHAARAQVHMRALTLETALGGSVISWDQAANALEAGFAACFNVTLHESPLSDAENLVADNLTREKYNAESWLTAI